MKLSVIIPNHNRADLLPITLRSIIYQSIAPSEVIVVDDGSTDDSVQVAQSFGPLVRVIQQANTGPGSARNRGFAESKGTYVLFFDSDDVATPYKIELQLQALEDTGADIAYGPFVKGVFRDNDFYPSGFSTQAAGLPKGDLAEILVCRWSIIPHTCLFRRSIVERSGGFPEDLRVAEDQLFFLNCLLAGARVIHTPGATTLYREGNAGKLSQTRVPQRAHEWAGFLLRARKRLLDHGKRDLIQDWRYRQRLWQAMCDLSGEYPELERELNAFFPKAKWPFQFVKYSQQYISGCRARLTGTRADRCFHEARFNMSSLPDNFIASLVSP